MPGQAVLGAAGSSEAIVASQAASSKSSWRRRPRHREPPLPLLAALFAAALLLVSTTLVIASLRQDAIQHAHEEQIVAAGLHTAQRTLAGNAVDYAAWDDAVRNLVLAFDAAWATRNLGHTVIETLNYDVSLVVDRQDRAVYGQVGAVEDAEHAAAVLGPAVKDIVVQARRGAGSPPRPAVAVLDGPTGLHVAAASAIGPEMDSALAPPPGPPSVLLFAQQLGPTFLTRIGNDFGLRGLALIEPHEALGNRASIDLTGPNGEVVGRLAWMPRHPGWDQLFWLVPALAGALLASAIFASLALKGARLARALRDSKARLRDFAEVSSDWLWETDQELRFAWFSPGFAQSAGLKPEALLGRRRDELRGGDTEGGDWDQHLADMAARRPFRDFTYSVRDDAGRQRIVRVSGKPVFDAEDRFCCYRGTGRNVTEEWEAARRLRESENRFRSLVENLRDIVFCRGVAGDGPHGYDAQGVQMFGADAARLAGTVDERRCARITSWYESIHPEDRPGYLEAERRRKEQGDSYTLEYRITHPGSGEQRWVRESAWVVDAPGEKRRYLDSYIIDVTEQRQREAALAEARALLQAQNEELGAARRVAEAAAQAKTDFLAAMSHEIRTPMTGVLGMADLLAAEKLTPAHKRYVDTIRTSGRHLLSIINSILDFSRIESGRLELERIDFALADVFEQVHSLLAPQAIERGLELKVELDTPRPLVLRGDPTRLRQVLVNLVGNGLKFTARGMVAMTARQQPGPEGTSLLRFEVRDTGIGIPRERQAELFQPFVQADSSTTRHYGGSGLGLVICRRLVEAMGGVIGVESVLERGSLFWFEISFEVGDSVAAAEQGAFEPARIRPLRVLVADDVPANRDVLGEMLGRHGHEVLFAEDGAAAVELAVKERLDVVLMDVQMPVMDGMEATRRIRQLPPPACGVPILALTANVMATERDRYRAAGMNSCLTKPVVWPELFAALASVAAGDELSNADAQEQPEPAPQALPLLDRVKLEEMARNLPSGMLQKLLARGLDGAGESWRRLGAALGDSETLAQEAHRLRGTAGTFGLVKISALGGTIENRAGRGEDVADLVAELGELVEASRRAVEQLEFGA